MGVTAAASQSGQRRRVNLSCPPTLVAGQPVRPGGGDRSGHGSGDGSADGAAGHGCPAGAGHAEVLGQLQTKYRQTSAAGTHVNVTGDGKCSPALV